MRDLLTAFRNLFESENKALDVHLAATGHRYRVLLSVTMKRALLGE